MRILHLSNLYAPIIGGLERSIATSSEALVRRGHEVTVLTLATPLGDGDEEINGVRVKRVRSVANSLVPGMNADATKPFHPTTADPLTTAAIHRELRTTAYDVVHSHDWIMYSYLPLRFGRVWRPHVHTAHDFGLTCVKKTFARDGRTCGGPRLTRCVPCAAEQYGRPRAAALTTALRAQRHHVPHQAVTAAWHGAAAGVVPSVFEAVGQGAVEALLAGTPLIATAAGGLADMIRDAETGLHVPPGDPGALVAALRRLLTDTALTARLRVAGHRRGLDYTAARVVPQIEEVYRACIAAAR